MLQCSILAAVRYPSSLISCSHSSPSGALSTRVASSGGMTAGGGAFPATVARWPSRELLEATYLEPPSVSGVGARPRRYSSRGIKRRARPKAALALKSVILMYFIVRAIAAHPDPLMECAMPGRYAKHLKAMELREKSLAAREKAARARRLALRAPQDFQKHVHEFEQRASELESRQRQIEENSDPL